MGGGARPFFVGGVICLVNSVIERNLNLLKSYMQPWLPGQLLRGILCFLGKEVWGNNRFFCPYISWAARAFNEFAVNDSDWRGAQLDVALECFMNFIT